MERKSILKSPSYWTSTIQLRLYNCAANFMKKNKMNRSGLAEHLGVTKGYVSQLLNGDYDHKLSKLVSLSLSFGYVPELTFIPIEEYVKSNEMNFKTPTTNLLTTSKYVHVDSKFSAVYNEDRKYDSSEIIISEAA